MCAPPWRACSKTSAQQWPAEEHDGAVDRAARGEASNRLGGDGGGEPDQLEHAGDYAPRTADSIIAALEHLSTLPANTATMPPLFANNAEREAFDARHHREHVHIGTLEGARGPHFLGIDAGSTTIKATLVNDDREIVWSSYATGPVWRRHR